MIDQVTSWQINHLAHDMSVKIKSITAQKSE